MISCIQVKRMVSSRLKKDDGEVMADYTFTFDTGYFASSNLGGAGMFALFGGEDTYSPQIAVKFIPSGYPTRFDPPPYKFPPSTQLFLSSPISQACLCRVS